MSIFDEPKIDCHNHVLDPKRFPYAPDVAYRPSAQEIGSAIQLNAMFDAYGVAHALVVGPNSGYGTDNRCLLDTIARSGGRFKGVAVVDNHVDPAELARLKSAGILGVTMNATYHGVAYYADARPLLANLVALDMFAQIQVEADQLIELGPMLIDSGVTIVVDHCGRPVPEAGLSQAGFAALLDLGRSGRACVKLSGYSKFSREPYPYLDAHRYVAALIEAFTPDACVWGSDWPFLRAPERHDYGPLLKLAERLLPDPASRRAVLWETPRRRFGFTG